MKKDDLVYIGHMLESARDAIARIESLDRAAFFRDVNLPLALTHLIQIIGEAARRVSPEFRAAHPEISWTSIVGMRHKIVHDYIHVDFETVWETATTDLPELVKQLETIPGV
jgi:uncharacterized protein with HEPN domain